MSRYDSSWHRGYDRGYGVRGQRGYDSNYSGWGDAWVAARDAMMQRRGRGPYAQGGWGGGYDRGIYGGGYPGYREYPGPLAPRSYYDGRSEPRGSGWRGGYDRGYRWGGDAGYGEEFAAERFVPEEAYRRHPEMEHPRRQTSGRWPSGAHGGPAFHGDADAEVERAVRQSLQQDGYIDADRIQVEVRDQVVTLRGEVSDYLEARYAWDDAWETAGVRGVVNQITVRTDRPAGEHTSDLPQTAGE